MNVGETNQCGCKNYNLSFISDTASYVDHNLCNTFDFMFLHKSLTVCKIQLMVNILIYLVVYATSLAYKTILMARVKSVKKIN